MNKNEDKLRLQLPELEIPLKDPFENDMLNRKENVEVLTHLIESTYGPRVISVDAEWGNGKTTFLKMLAQYLDNQDHAVVKFNAWETDFCEHPFIALFSELEIALNQFIDRAVEDSQSENKYDKIIEQLKSVASILAIVVSKLVTISFRHAGVTLDINIDSDSDKKKNIVEYKEAFESLKEFKCTLEKTVSALYELNYKSLVIVIDELDRCRPSYAIELLEVAKHLFGVENIVFILGINRSQLEHSIEALYGSKFNAQEYSRRFFDVDYKLPSPSRDDFINNLISNINIQSYFDSNNDSSVICDFDTVRQMLKIYFVDSSISLRTIQQTIQQLGLVHALLKKDKFTYIPMAVIMLIIKTIDSKIFEDFVAGNISDLNLVEKLPNMRNNSSVQKHAINCFEAIIIVIAKYIKPSIQNAGGQTPLYNEYFETCLNAPNSEKEIYQAKVITLVDNMQNIPRDWNGINNLIKRIEFVSEELLPSEN